MKALSRHQAHVLVTTILFLFFFQLLAEFIEAVYAFGLLGTSIPPEIVAVLFLFSPALFLLGRRNRMPRWVYLTLVFVLIVCRLTAVLLDTRGRMLVSGAGVAAGWLWIPAHLWQLAHQQRKKASLEIGLGLIGSLLFSVLFRSLGSGSDISLMVAFQGMGWVLAGVTAVLLFQQPYPVERAAAPSISSRRLIAPAIGLTSVVLLLYFVYTSPNVIARWTGASYPIILFVMMIGLMVFVGVFVFKPTWLTHLNKSVFWGWNGLFVLTLVATILPHQIRFPANPASYPLYEPNIAIWQSIPLYLMLLLFPIIFFDAVLFAEEIVTARPSLPALGGVFTLSSLFLLVMVFGHVFTTVYDYIPVIGPFLRDKFWLVHLVVGGGLLLPLLVVRPRIPDWSTSRSWGGGSLAMAGLVLMAVLYKAPNVAEPEPKTAVRILTYNIQQGYSEDGRKNFGGQLELLREVDADIIALQESDTNRIAGGNADVVRYFADALDMHVYYGPKTVPGTFGIALLSKYPIENPRTFYMYSEGEQTATIEAKITAGKLPYYVFITHLGNGGPLVQQEAIMQAVQGKAPLILVGDFNFRPDTDPYQLTTTLLDDAWLRLDAADRTPEPENRIDHIFISPAVQVESMRYILDPASDHPAATAVLSLP